MWVMIFVKAMWSQSVELHLITKLKPDSHQYDRSLSVCSVVIVPGSMFDSDQVY